MRETPRCRARDYITRKLFRVDQAARDRRRVLSPLLQPIQSKHHKPETAPKLPPRSAQTRTHHKPAHKAASRKRSSSYAQDDPKDLRPTTSSTLCCRDALPKAAAQVRSKRPTLARAGSENYPTSSTAHTARGSRESV